MSARRRAKQRIEGVHRLASDTPDGRIVRVTGVVRSLDMVLRSPTTGRTVVAYAMEVGGREPMSTVPFACVELVPFAVEHAALGRIVVDSQFAELALPEHRAERVDARAWADFCDARQLSPSAVGIERPLLAGVTVTILGTAMRRDRDAQLCLIGDVEHPLLIVDED